MRTVCASAMVLGAGLGTRLRPLSDELPKPLVPVGDRSVLGHAAERLATAGFTRLVVNAHAMHELVERACAELALPAHVVIERERPLGTAGGLHGAAEVLGEGD